MKSFLFLLVLALPLIGCGQSGSMHAANDFKKLEWLVGTWTRTNVTKPGKSSHERWEKISEYHLRGYGVTMQGPDTTFLEKISILIKDNTIYYVADVPGNAQPVYFKLTEISNQGFTCENPQHDFPKKLTYQLEGTKLKAQISGDGKSIDYIFERQ